MTTQSRTLHGRLRTCTIARRDGFSQIRARDVGPESSSRRDELSPCRRRALPLALLNCLWLADFGEAVLQQFLTGVRGIHVHHIAGISAAEQLRLDHFGFGVLQT